MKRPRWLSSTALIFYALILGVISGYLFPSESHPADQCDGQLRRLGRRRALGGSAGRAAARAKRRRALLRARAEGQSLDPWSQRSFF